MRSCEYEAMFAVEDRHWWYAGLHQEIAQHLQRFARDRAQSLQELRILDAGCGTGGLLAHLRRLLAGLVIVLVVAALYIVPKHPGLEPERYWRQRVESALGQLVGAQAGQALSAGSSYHLYPERFYTYTSNKLPLPPALSEVAWGFVKGWGYFLLAPAPWAITTLLQVATAPEMILWYMLLIFAVRGVWRWMRAAPAEGGTLVLWIMVLSSLNALTTGNVGVAFRHRSMVIPFYLMLSVIGFMPMGERMRRPRAVAVPVV